MRGWRGSSQWWYPFICHTREDNIEEPDIDVDSNNEWMDAHFPAGSRSVTISRGDNSFGIMMMEEKVGVSFLHVCDDFVDV